MKFKSSAMSFDVQTHQFDLVVLLMISLITATNPSPVPFPADFGVKYGSKILGPIRVGFRAHRCQSTNPVRRGNL
jgi:hypothetical protein